MDGFDFEQSTDLADVAASSARPRNRTVVGLLFVAALIISYLLAYCLINALVAAEVMTHWGPGRDPRPKIFISAFLTLTSSFAGIGYVVRSLSRRQLSRIDEMESD